MSPDPSSTSTAPVTRSSPSASPNRPTSSQKPATCFYYIGPTSSTNSSAKFSSLWRYPAPCPQRWAETRAPRRALRYKSSTSSPVLNSPLNSRTSASTPLSPHSHPSLSLGCPQPDTISSKPDTPASPKKHKSLKINTTILWHPAGILLIAPGSHQKSPQRHQQNKK